MCAIGHTDWHGVSLGSELSSSQGEKMPRGSIGKIQATPRTTTAVLQTKEKCHPRVTVKSTIHTVITIIPPVDMLSFPW